MRRIWVLILFLVISCQLSAVSGEQSFSETENWIKSQGHKVAGSQGDYLSDSATLRRLCDSVSLRPYDFYESQIRLADSLYKNYLPQYNFDEVKAAMEFFDSLTADNRQQSTDNRLRARKTKCTEDTRPCVSTGEKGCYPRTVDCCPLTVDIEFSCAKAHYYHAVGLTERDDIVGACEHYLTALEIMEFETENLRISKSEKRSQSRKVARSQSDCLSDSATQIPCDPETLRPCDLNKEDYEKVRFVSLLYTRLGELFHNEGYCNLAIVKYRKALRYVEILGNNESKSQIMKAIGNSYQLLNNPDSSLYFYNESLQTSSNLINTLDVEKCIAHLLFEKGEKDSAYLLIKNNLDKIDNINVRYSYYNTLGEMYMKDIEYDSAIYYFDKSINSNITSIKVTAVINLSAIYDSIDDYTKKAYYDNIISKISIKDINKSLETNKLQDVYDKYKKRKVEKERIESRNRVKIVVSTFTVVVFLSIFIIMLIWHKFNRNDKKYSDLLEVKEKYIAIKEKTIERISKEIEHKESEIKKHIEIIEVHKSDINFLKNELSTKEQEISSKDADIKKMENDLSAKKAELARLQDNVNENEIKINKINKDNRTKEKQIYAYIEEIGKLKTEIDEARNNLTDIKFRNSLIEGKIKSANDKLKKNEEEINKYKLEISDFRNKLDIISSSINNSNYNPSHTGIELYLQSNVCSKILNEINNLSARNRDTNALTPLKPEEFVMLLNSASLYINNFSNGIISKYSKLKKEDLYYLSLAIIDLKDKQISSLLGVTYNSIRIRKKNICSMLGIKNNELKSFLMNICS